MAWTPPRPPEPAVGPLAGLLRAYYRSCQFSLKRNPSAEEVVGFLLDRLIENDFELLAKLHAKSGARPSPRSGGPKQAAPSSLKQERNRKNGVSHKVVRRD